MKQIQFEPGVPAHIHPIPQHIAVTILQAIHREAETSSRRIKPFPANLKDSSASAIQFVADRREADR